VIITAATNVAVLNRRHVGHGLWAMRAIEVVAENRQDRAVTAGPDVDATLAGCFDRLCQRSGLLVSNMLRLRSLPFKQLAGYRARWLSGAYGESAVPRRERVGTCEIEGGGSSGVRRDRGNIVLLMGRS
jgi:hypothetical protein